jgi:hypothetical protein
MATRNTRLILKNSVIPSQTLPSSGVLQGEGLVNLGDGIFYFSGGTSGSPTWVQSDNPTTGYFEVGSNLYQLKVRDKIISYSGVTNLSGKFLSGTTTGFVLADIADIVVGVDSYVTGATWNPNVLTIELNNGKPNVPVTIDSFTALTINGNLEVTGTETVNNLTITGTGLYDVVAIGSNPNEIVNYSSLTGFSQTNDVYVTGSTLTSATNNTNTQQSTLSYHGIPIGGPYTIDTENTYTTGGTYNSGTTSIDFARNDGATYSVDLSNIDVNDTYVTGGTNNSATTSSPNATIDLLYNQDVAPNTYSLPYSNVFVTGFTYNNNTFTISDNSGSTFNTTINTVTGLTVNGNLTVTGDTSVQSLDAANVDVSGDVTIQGSLTVFGPSVSAFTSNLYVEDSNITLNYNPTGSTTLTSVGAGWTIQDGSGIANTATTLNIGVSYLNPNLDPNTEYTASTGNENRNLFTQLGDIIIRNTNYDPNSPDGVRVLGEGDILCGGFY